MFTYETTNLGELFVVVFKQEKVLKTVFTFKRTESGWDYVQNVEAKGYELHRRSVLFVLNEYDFATIEQVAETMCILLSYHIA